MNRIVGGIIVLILLAGRQQPAAADAKSKAVRETAEYVLRVFGKEVGKESAETLSRKLEVLVARHGEELLLAVRKAGPRAMQFVEEAGTQAPQVVKLMVRHGDEAVWIVSRPRGLAIFVKHGEEAVPALLRHKGIAEPLIEAHARPAIQAMNAINGQNGRRLAMLAESGELAKMGQTPELLAVIGKYGNRALAFVWGHKGALAVTAVLTAFLADPVPFLDGAKDITQIVGQAAVQPLAAASGQVAVEAARSIEWNRLLLLLLLIVAGGLVVRYAARFRVQTRTERGSHHVTESIRGYPPGTDGQ